MLRFIEYTILAVSLVVVVGLIVGGSRTAPKPGETLPPAPSGDHPEASDPGKNA